MNYHAQLFTEPVDRYVKHFYHPVKPKSLVIMRLTPKTRFSVFNDENLSAELHWPIFPALSEG